MGDPVVSTGSIGQGYAEPKDPRPLSGAAGAERNEPQTHRVVPPREGNEGRRDGRQEVVAP